METTNNKPTISKSQFATDVNNGMTKTELITKYGVSAASIKAIAKQLNVTIKRATLAKYVLTDDVVDETFKPTNKTVSEFVSLNN